MRIWSVFTLVKLIPFLFIYAGIFAIANDLTAKVILYDDAIEVIRSLRRGSLQRKDIAGYRFIWGFKGPSYLILIPKRPGLKRLRVSLAMRTDEVFSAWIGGLPDLSPR